MTVLRAQPAPTPPPAATTARAQLQQLEALARTEMATLEVRAELQRQREAASHKAAPALSRELQDLAWDLGLDASELA